MPDKDGFTTVSHKKSRSRGNVKSTRSGSSSPTRKNSTPRPRRLSDPVMGTGTPGVGRRGNHLVIGSAVNQLVSQDSSTESEGGGSTQEIIPAETSTENVNSSKNSVTSSSNDVDPTTQNSTHFAFGEISPDEIAISTTNDSILPDVEMKDVSTPLVLQQAGPSRQLAPSSMPLLPFQPLPKGPFTQDDLESLVPSTGKGKGRAPQPVRKGTTPPSSEDEEERDEREQRNLIADQLGAKTAQQVAQSQIQLNELCTLNSSTLPNDIMQMLDQLVRQTMAKERRSKHKRKTYEYSSDSSSSSSSSNSSDSTPPLHKSNAKSQPRKKSKKSDFSYPTHISEPSRRHRGQPRSRDVASTSHRTQPNPSVNAEQRNLALRRGFTKDSNPN
ncbi:hypothetical protein DL96DRAFT_1720325 [Flagelloscypha sp. PMI_526]|nr:hypothetical protein DL96DRAFT_1720325 [Flagelloscypha sp. PMI_526]